MRTAAADKSAAGQYRRRFSSPSVVSSAPQGGEHRNHLFLSGEDLGQKCTVSMVSLDIECLLDGLLISCKQKLRAVQQYIGDHQNHRVQGLLLPDSIHHLEELRFSLQQALRVHTCDLSHRQIVAGNVKLLVIRLQNGLRTLVISTGGGENRLAQLLQGEIRNAGHPIGNVDIPLGTGGRLEHYRI